MALVKTIKDRLTHDTIYPITKADAVYLSDNETTIEGALGNLSTISSIGDGTIAGAISSLNTKLPRIIRKTFTVNFDNERYKLVSIDVSDSTKTPYGIIGIQFSTIDWSIYRFNIESTTAYIGIWKSTPSTGSLTGYIDILYF